MTDKMTKGERAELTSLVRKREKVMKSQATERSALLLAEFDAQSAKIYSFDDDPVWAAATEEVKAIVDIAREKIARRCKAIGIPVEFAPNINFYWEGRGHNAVSSRRAELRRAAKSRIDAMEKEAVTKIERLSLQAQTEILAQGLDTEAARRFLESMPTMDSLMPPVQIGEIQTLVETQRKDRRLSYDQYN